MRKFAQIALCTVLLILVLAWTEAAGEGQAELLTTVDTDEHVVSLVFEGYADIITMDLLEEVLAEHGVISVFFVNGIMASEYPNMVASLSAANQRIGNGGIRKTGQVQTNTVSVNVRQLSRMQNMISEITGEAPTLCCCTDTVYTADVLKAVQQAGMTAAVKPTAFLNHDSFSSRSDADMYVRGLVNGTLISFKLGMDLTDEEAERKMAEVTPRPVVDTPPGISHSSVEMPDGTFLDAAEAVDWLLSALEADGYTLVPPEALPLYAETISQPISNADPAMLSLLRPENYVLPLTEFPLDTVETFVGTQRSLDGILVIGNETVANLESYVTWHRRSDPFYMGSARFFSVEGLTVEMALNGAKVAEVEDKEVSLPEAVKALGASRVYLQIPFETRAAYEEDAYLANLRLLIYEIESQNPGVRVVLQTLFPAIKSVIGNVSNREIFDYNLMLARMCILYQIPLLDPAYVMRDAEGNLKDSYCLDKSGSGTHINDAGCAEWLLYLEEHVPTL